MASLPTVTLANHTSLLTGCHPGHHGVLHNAWYDRALGRQVVTESPATWQEAMQWLAPGVETIHQALKRRRPEAVTVSVNEPADVGADYSTFDLFRAGPDRASCSPTSSVLPPFTTEAFADGERGLPVEYLRRLGGARPGHRDLGRDPPRGSLPAPAFTWVSFSLTDSAFHEGGPHSEHRRGGRARHRRPAGRAAGRRRGGRRSSTAPPSAWWPTTAWRRTTSPSNGDWGDALRAAGISFRDEASGFLYLDVVTDPHRPPETGGLP